MKCNRNGQFETGTAYLPGVLKFVRNEVETLEKAMAKRDTTLTVMVLTDNEHGHSLVVREKTYELLVKHPLVGRKLVEELRYFADHLENDLPPQLDPNNQDKEDDNDAEIPGIPFPN
jgi:hypothetical protein